ncbi:hypothetical protein, partial [Psychroserpens sp.]|uniref:hypothetical protein n=1 Tax=Psychroserpens sp. TaxID=2020870 RepID=UPI0038593001
MKKTHILLFALLITGFSFSQINPGHATFDFDDTGNNSSELAPTIENLNTNEDLVVSLNSELVFLKLRASTNSNSYTTAFYFNDNASLGFDFGYDAGIFGVTPSFVLYSNLVEENTGLDISLQAVNTSDVTNVTFPLGLNASQGIALTFSVSETTLPESIEVYLDDTVANTSTLLNNSDYIVTPTSTLAGTGRFFLRMVGPSVTYTYNGSWSPSDPNGIATSLDDILIESGDAIFDSDLTVNTLIVNPGASASVNAGTMLTVNNGVTLESNSTSYSSLIQDGTVVGAMTYERHVNINGSGTTGSNDLVSAPLTGQPFNALATANPNILNNGTLYLFGPFEKNTGQFVTWAGTDTFTLDAGVGYRAATSDNSTVTFTGTAENGTVTNNIVNQGTNNEEWNLVGNPYPSYLNVQQFLLGDAGSGLVNIQLFDPPTAAIYGY